MAKTPKSPKSSPGGGSDRRAVVEQMRSQQRKADKRRNFMIVGVCVVVALLIVGAAAYRPLKDWWDLRQFEEIALSDIGAAADVCQEPTTKPANGQLQHVPEGTELSYPDAPPAFGEHYGTWEPISRKFYGSDRPDLGYLVHNLEHGYTILWYDETAANDAEMLDQVRAISEKFEGDDTNFRLKFKAAPWTEEDGAAFPEGQHIALTHWSLGEGGGEQDQVGVTQYCSEPSGAALEAFMEEYPYTDSPEPNGG